MEDADGRDVLMAELKQLRGRVPRTLSDGRIVDRANEILKAEHSAAVSQARKRNLTLGLPPPPPEQLQLIPSRSAFSGWMNGRKLPSWEHLWAVVRAMSAVADLQVPPHPGTWRAFHRLAAAAPAKKLTQVPATPGELQAPEPFGSANQPRPPTGNLLRGRLRAWVIVGVAACLVLAGAISIGARVFGGSSGEVAANPNVAPTGELPFTLTSDWYSGMAFAALLPQKSVVELGPPPITNRWQWVRDRRGVHSSNWVRDGERGVNGAIEVVLRATSADLPVTLIGMDVEVLDRKPPIVGTKVSSGGGGPKVGRYINYDVDTEPPRVLGSSRNTKTEGGDRLDPLQFPYQITTTDTEMFVIWVSTQKYDVTWQVRLKWSTGVASGEIVIDDHGVPFEVSAVGEGSNVCQIWDNAWIAALSPTKGDPPETC